MENLFVPYSLALLAKEKGFDGKDCLATYSGLNKGLYMPAAAFSTPIDVAAPLYQQLVDWFREKRELHVSVASMALGYVGQHNNTPNEDTWNVNKRFDSEPSKDYYEALTAALTEAFKLI